MKTVLIVVVVLVVGCKKEKECSVSVGTCTSQQAQHCGISIACDDRRFELKCTPPVDPDAKQMDCQCVDNGVLGKTVQVQYPLSSPSAQALANTACGWK